MANFATWSSIDKSPDVSLKEGNLGVIVGASGNTQNAMCTISPPAGKWYFEHIITKSSIQPAHAAAIGVVVGRTGDPNSFSPFGGSNVAMYYGGDGTLYRGGNQGNLISWPVGSVLQIALDVTNQKIWFGVNGTWYNSGDPAAGTNATVSSLGTGKYEFYTADGASGETHEARTNFGQLPFQYDPPSGFVALSTENLPEPTISNLAAEKPEDYFNTVLYTGNGSTQSITGVGFQPDFMWIKSRGTTRAHHLIDAVRGANLRLFSNLTNAESSQVVMTSIDSDGFSVTTANGSDGINATSDPVVAWCWKAGGTAVSNTDGSITSSVSANTESGFSIVSYTGVGGTSTVGHGLSQVPELMLFKNRDATVDWQVYSNQLPSSQKLLLNLTNGASNTSNWNGTDPTSSVFTVSGSGSGTVNSSGEDVIVYCWHSVEGYSSFGSYIGNGSTDGPFVYTGFRPAFVMVKRTDASNNWVMLDSERDTYNVANASLLADRDDAETDYGIDFDFLSNGFKLRSSGNPENASDGDYIFMAIAESPFKYSSAR